MAYCVYKHTFPNGKVYIGITRTSPEHRWRGGKGYLSKKKKTKEYSQPLMAHAILKYGWENIKHEILFDELTKKEAEKKEIELIAEYQSNKKEFGYNIANGGSSTGVFTEQTKRKISESKKANKTYYRSVKCIETGKVYMLIDDAAKEFGIHPSGITCCCRGKQKTAGGYHWEYVYNPNICERTMSKEARQKLSESQNGKGGRRVRCIETGVIYNSISAARKATGIKSISRACSGSRNVAGGYHWEYVKEDLKYNAVLNREKLDKKKSKMRKSVRCIETGIVYNGLGDADRQTGIDRTSIGRCCNGRLKTAGGFHWEWENKDTAIVKTEKAKIRRVRCVETGAIYESASCAGRAVNRGRDNIRKACEETHRTVAGCHWEYANEDIQ